MLEDRGATLRRLLRRQVSGALKRFDLFQAPLNDGSLRRVDRRSATWWRRVSLCNDTNHAGCRRGRALDGGLRGYLLPITGSKHQSTEGLWPRDVLDHHSRTIDQLHDHVTAPKEAVSHAASNLGIFDALERDLILRAREHALDHEHSKGREDKRTTPPRHQPNQEPHARRSDEHDRPDGSDLMVCKGSPRQHEDGEGHATGKDDRREHQRSRIRPKREHDLFAGSEIFAAQPHGVMVLPAPRCLADEILDTRSGRLYTFAVGATNLLRRARRMVRMTLAASLAAGGLLVTPVATSISGADGPAPCSAGPPAHAYRGFCATYNQANTFYGSYGPGFPTPTGWGLCALSPARGGAYPAPGYGYVLSGAPPGADTSQFGPLGFAFSRATTTGFWNGAPGQFTADQAAVGAKLLYDVVAWHAPTPSMDPGVGAAFWLLRTWMDSAQGATGAPNITVGLVGGGSSFTKTASLDVSVWFPGSNRGVSTVGVLLSLTNATFSATGSRTGGLTTGSNGHATISITADGTGPVTVTVQAAASVGQLGLLFYRPTLHVLNAQTIVLGAAPITVVQNATFTSLAPPPVTGTLSIAKSGNDTAYWPIAGAVFDVLRGTAVLDTLVVGTNGSSPPSGPLPVGTYLIREVSAPPGYELAPDQQASVVASRNTVVAFTGQRGDLITPATVVLHKVDASTSAALAGAVLGVRYDPLDNGSYSQDLGTCTTGSDGSCAPTGNDGSALLPGRYLVTEISPPAGYAPDPSGPVALTLAPGQSGVVRFADPPLVPQSFVKVATGNINPSSVIVAGAVITVTNVDKVVVAGCTTASDARCSTESVLTAGDHYCWEEVVAPIGLEAGAHGCFTASAESSTIPIKVTDKGRYVEVLARKVSTVDPTVGVPGAVFDFYRMDAGKGPTKPTPPSDALALSGGTWVARATSMSNGFARAPLQLPGYAYCVVEHAAPPGFDRNVTPSCTGILEGTVSTPPTSATVTVADVETATQLFVFKTNASEPDVGVPGAVYDLFVKNPGPPSTPATPNPAAPLLTGLSWFASGTTDTSGRLGFDIPVGYQWCIKERSTPPDFLIDPALHCTGTIDAASPDPVRTVAVTETPSTLTLTGFKFNTLHPGVGIPGASYALFVDGPMPSGYVGPTPPAWLLVPAGMALFATQRSDAGGFVRFTIPSGSRWCLQEIAAPPGFTIDAALHCTSVLTSSAPLSATQIALPEVATLAYTGQSLPIPLGIALVSVGVGALVAASIMRRVRRRRGSDGMII